jgi:hypothetical protein
MPVIEAMRNLPGVCIPEGKGAFSPGDLVEFGFDGSVTGEALVFEVDEHGMFFDRNVSAMAFPGGEIRRKGNADRP